MEDSILISTKKALGIQKDLTAFDQDILMSINSVFSILYQIGVISSTGTYRIEDETTKWEDLFGEDIVLLDMIKSYIYIRVRIIFDPPTSSFVLDSLKTQAQELEWRIYIQSDFSNESENDGSTEDSGNDGVCDSCDLHEPLSDENIESVYDEIMSSKR